MISLAPLRARAFELPVEKPQSDERVQIDERQTKPQRRGPRTRAQGKADGEDPRPIAPTVCTPAQIDERAEPQDERRVPTRDAHRPCRLLQVPRLAQRIEQRVG